MSPRHANLHFAAACARLRPSRRPRASAGGHPASSRAACRMSTASPWTPAATRYRCGAAIVQDRSRHDPLRPGGVMHFDLMSVRTHVLPRAAALVVSRSRRPLRPRRRPAAEPPARVSLLALDGAEREQTLAAWLRLLSFAGTLLHRRTGHRGIRAVHAAIPGYRLEDRSAMTAIVEPLTGVRRHRLGLGVAARRTGNGGLEKQRYLLYRHVVFRDRHEHPGSREPSYNPAAARATENTGPRRMPAVEAGSRRN